MYGKIFASIYEGSLYGQWQALVTFQQMIVLCDEHGVVDMTPEVLAARTSIPLDIIRAGIAVLEAPDDRSRTPDEEGRRIVRLAESRDWGWRITNYEHYRKIRSAEERRIYMRQYQRERRANSSDLQATQSTSRKHSSTPVADVSDVSQSRTASTSASASDLSEPEETQEPVGREHHFGDEIAAFLDEHFFAEINDRDVISGLIRTARVPSAVMGVLRRHLEGMNVPKRTPAEIATAVLEYQASGEPQFKAALFDGFVRRAVRNVEVGERRRQNTHEQKAIDREAEERERARAEDDAAQAMLDRFTREHPERYAELANRVMDETDTSTAFGKAVAHGKLVALVRAEVRKQNGN